MASRAADSAVEGTARWMIWRRWKGPRTSRQRLAVAIVALALMIVLVIPLFEEPVDLRAPVARAGVVDYSAYGRPDRPVHVAGQWRLTWFEPKLAAGGPARGFVAVPGQWTGTKLPDGTALPLTGHVRYDVVIRGLPAGRYSKPRTASSLSRLS